MRAVAECSVAQMCAVRESGLIGRVRSRRFVVAAALLQIAVVAGCDAERPVGLRPGEPLFSSSPPAEPFFVAYTGAGWTTQLGIQTFPVWTAYGPGQYRVWVNSMCGVDPCAPYITNFAASYPGRLYVVGDEPDKYDVPPAEYAADYKFFVDSILRVDPTAKFSPAGFTAASGGAYGNYTVYAEAFYNEHKRLFNNQPPRVDEWRFHNFGGSQAAYNNLANWKSEITAAVDWSVLHGAPMYLGAWNFYPWDKPLTALLSDVQEAMAFLRSTPNLRGAGWYGYENFDGVPDYLVYDDLQTLTPHGETYRYGPMSPTISGPSCVTPGSTGGYYATVSGGVPPVTFVGWYRDTWTYLGTSNPLTWDGMSGTHTLRADYRDKYDVLRSVTNTIC
jgi:hypothetical protein